MKKTSLLPFEAQHFPLIALIFGLFEKRVGFSNWSNIFKYKFEKSASLMKMIC